MERLLLALAIVAVAGVLSTLVRRNRQADPPTQSRSELPSQLDRRDFDGDNWLVAVFTSDSCTTCANVVRKAQVLASPHVTVATASFQARPDLHRRYDIDAVPCLVIADPDGVVHGGFLGPVTATDLWAAIANAREPGSIDRSGGCDRH
jgi:hypothetical protein